MSYAVLSYHNNQQAKKIRASTQYTTIELTSEKTPFTPKTSTPKPTSENQKTKTLTLYDNVKRCQIM
tara:strand:+ start:389 stop:589 length:201 start_codon:yes stop_codon:yes gene_type:complete